MIDKRTQCLRRGSTTGRHLQCVSQPDGESLQTSMQQDMAFALSFQATVPV